MPCQASAKTGVIVAQLCVGTLCTVCIFILCDCIHARWSPILCACVCVERTCVHTQTLGSTSEAVEEVRRWASTSGTVAGMMRNIHRD